MTASMRHTRPGHEDVIAAFGELDDALAALVDLHGAPKAHVSPETQERDLALAEARVRHARVAFAVLTGE